jgi:hypothetical protein
MSKLLKKDLAVFLGTGAGLGAAGYADLKNVEYQMQKERDAKENEKVEEMKRKQEPSGGGSGETKAIPKPYKSGGKVSSASKRADGCCTKGKTKGRFV